MQVVKYVYTLEARWEFERIDSVCLKQRSLPNSTSVMKIAVLMTTFFAFIGMTCAAPYTEKTAVQMMSEQHQVKSFASTDQTLAAGDDVAYVLATLLDIVGQRIHPVGLMNIARALLDSSHIIKDSIQ